MNGKVADDSGEESEGRGPPSTTTNARAMPERGNHVAETEREESLFR